MWHSFFNDLSIGYVWLAIGHFATLQGIAAHLLDHCMATVYAVYALL